MARPDAIRAVATIRSAISEGGDFITRYKQHGDFQYLMNELGRWKERILTALQHQVGPGEAAAFRRIRLHPDDRTDLDVMAGYADHIRFLVALGDELEAHPADVLARAAEPASTARGTRGARAPLEYPKERMTLHWVFHNAPLGFWMRVAAIEAALFTAGLAAGRWLPAVWAGVIGQTRGGR